MKKIVTILILGGVLAAALVWLVPRLHLGAESQIYGVTAEAPIEDIGDEWGVWGWLADWERPSGPPRVGIQVGHWKNDELPDELARIRGNTGAQGGGYWEWEVNLMIAEALAEELETYGIVVDILPSTVPEAYWADVFVAIHADGNDDTGKSGFKFAAPRRDVTGKSERLVGLVRESYDEATGMAWDSNITRNMRGYYAFNWRRYEHSIHPMTVAMIAETGFLTSYQDRLTIVDQPEVVAAGLTGGIVSFLEEEGVL